MRIHQWLSPQERARQRKAHMDAHARRQRRRFTGRRRYRYGNETRGGRQRKQQRRLQEEAGS